MTTDFEKVSHGPGISGFRMFALHGTFVIGLSLQNQARCLLENALAVPWMPSPGLTFLQRCWSLMVASSTNPKSFKFSLLVPIVKCGVGAKVRVSRVFHLLQK